MLQQKCSTSTFLGVLGYKPEYLLRYSHLRVYLSSFSQLMPYPHHLWVWMKYTLQGTGYSILSIYRGPGWGSLR